MVNPKGQNRHDLAVRQYTKNFQGRLTAPYQPAGVKWMLTRELCDTNPKGGILCDEMGLGKTIQVIATMLGNPIDTTLIVVPVALVSQWRDALKQFAHVDARTIDASQVSKMRHTELKEPGVFITTYSAFTSHGASDFDTPFFRVTFGRIVLDEAHLIKNRNSKIHRVLCEVDSDIKWCLTGTPITNKANDFASLLQFVGFKNVNLGDAAREFTLRRTKEDVARVVPRHGLPKLHIDIVRAPLSPEEHELYTSISLKYARRHAILKSKLEASSSSSSSSSDGSDLPRTVQNLKFEWMTRLRQCATNPQLVLDGLHKKSKNAGPAPKWTHACTKLDLLKREILAQPKKEKTLVFCHWTAEMDAIQSMLTSVDIENVRFDGKMNARKRDENLTRFKDSNRAIVLVIQIIAGGVGLNIQAATRVYINSLDWNGTSELQAIGRAHRTGQLHEVFVKRLVMENTVDDRVIDTQDEKMALAAIVFDDERIVKSLNASSTVSIPCA